MANNERQLSFGDFNRDWNGNWADRLARRDETRIQEWYNSSVWLEEPDEWNPRSRVPRMFGFDLPPVQLGLGDTRSEVELYDISLETAWYNSGASSYEADR